jgi:ABC-type protease/lipase transport system fused ATPase/permease subunit
MDTTRQVLHEVRRAVLAACTLAAFAALTALALPLYALHVFEALAPGGNPHALLPASLVAAGALLAGAGLTAARDRILLRAALWLDHTLGPRLLEAGLRLGLQAAELEVNAGALARLRAALANGTLLPVLDARWAALFLLAMMLLHPVLGATAALFALALLLASLAQGSRIAWLEEARIRAAARARHWWRTLAAGNPVTGALGLAEGGAGEWERRNRAHVAGAYELGRRASRLATLACAAQALSALVLLAVGAWLVAADALTLGALVACLILNALLLAPLVRVASMMPSLQGARLAYRHLASLTTDAARPSGRAPRPATSLVLDNIACRTLEGVSLALPPGRTLAITGPSGSGKSTLAALIAGALAPTRGTVELDGAALAASRRGEPVRVGYLPDEPALFEGTVRANIARFGDAGLLAVSLAAMRAGVHDALAALPQGYETHVGQGGSAISMRERRAVALARAVFGAPGLIVLDEPDLGLDAGSLHRLARVLDDLRHEGTSLVIATRNAQLIEMADVVAMLDGDRLLSVAPGGQPLVAAGQDHAGPPARVH